MENNADYYYWFRWQCIVVLHTCYKNIPFYSVAYLGRCEYKEEVITFNENFTQSVPFVFIRISVMCWHFITWGTCDVQKRWNMAVGHRILIKIVYKNKIFVYDYYPTRCVFISEGIGNTQQVGY